MLQPGASSRAAQASKRQGAKTKAVDTKVSKPAARLKRQQQDSSPETAVVTPPSKRPAPLYTRQQQEDTIPRELLDELTAERLDTGEGRGNLQFQGEVRWVGVQQLQPITPGQLQCLEQNRPAQVGKRKIQSKAQGQLPTTCSAAATSQLVQNPRHCWFPAGFPPTAERRGTISLNCCVLLTAQTPQSSSGLTPSHL